MAAPYRLGLLLCDREREALTRRFYGFHELFRRAFAPLAPTLQWRPYDVLGGELPATPGECDGYLLSGSRASVYEPEAWIETLAAFVRRLAS